MQSKKLFLPKKAAHEERLIETKRLIISNFSNSVYPPLNNRLMLISAYDILIEMKLCQETTIRKGRIRYQIIFR